MLAHDGPLADELKAQFRELLQPHVMVAVEESSESVPR